MESNYSLRNPSLRMVSPDPDRLQLGGNDGEMDKMNALRIFGTLRRRIRSGVNRETGEADKS